MPLDARVVTETRLKNLSDDEILRENTVTPLEDSLQERLGEWLGQDLAIKRALNLFAGKLELPFDESEIPESIQDMLEVLAERPQITLS
jgi:hypothetical protein